MAKCEFSIPLSISPKELISRASSAFSSAGGALQGNEESGHFQLPTPLGKVSGEFNFSEGQIHIVIHNKPMLVSCNRIRDELSSRIS